MFKTILFSFITLFLFLSLWLPVWADEITLDNPLGTTDPNVLYTRIIQGFLAAVGTMALIFFIYGGFLWLTSAGSPDKIKKGRDTLIWAVIGIAVVFLSYVLVSYVFAVLGGAI